MEKRIQNIEDFKGFVNSNFGKNIKILCHANGKKYNGGLGGATNTGFQINNRFINFPKTDYIEYNSDNTVTFYCLPSYSMITSTTKAIPSLTFILN